MIDIKMQGVLYQKIHFIFVNSLIQYNGVIIMVKDIGQRIAEFRRMRGLNQDELAELATLSRISVARYETGKIEPGAQALGRIADALEVTTDELLGRTEAQEQPENDERWQISERIRRDPNLRILFEQTKKAKPEHIRAAAAMLKSLEGGFDE